MNQPEQKQSDSKPRDQENDAEANQVPDIVVHEVVDPVDQPNNNIQKSPIDEENKNQPEDQPGSPEKDGEENEPSQQEEDEEEEKEAEGAQPGAKRQSSESNRDDNDTSQLQAIGGKKCFNKLCNSKKIYKKIRSKVQTSRYRFLCKNCYDNYVNNAFCEYCEQIYSSYDESQDDIKWVGCDKCERWNHIECERRYRHKNFQISKDKDIQYQCLSCSKKNRNGLIIQEPAVETNKRKVVDRDYEGTRNYRAKVEINKEQRIPIFHKKPDIFPCLEAFLQTYNFRVYLNDGMIRQDLQSLRSLNRRPPIDDQGKKPKKMKPEY